MNDNSQNVADAMSRNLYAALTAMGIKAQSLILGQMQSGYGRPIRQTGDLQRDVSYEVTDSVLGGKGTVCVGNTLNYSTFVHEGTVRMSRRPYITDALAGSGAMQQLQDVAEAALKQGM